MCDFHSISMSYRPIVVPTSVKTRTIQNQTVSVSTLPANHSQARFSQGILLGRVTELEKTLREERISFKSTIDECEWLYFRI